jgi:hypothetical protein
MSAMDKVTLDFENEMVEWDTDHQKGTEHFHGLRKRKPLILAAMGYEEYNISGVVNIINAFANGEMTEDELKKGLDAEKGEKKE